MKYLLLIPLFFLVGCSSTSKILNAEACLASAFNKVTLADREHAKAEKAKDAQIANLSQEVKILLKLPSPSLTAANQLLDSSLSLTGAPSKTESQMEDEVAKLLANKAQNEIEIANITKENEQIKANLDQAERDKTKAETQVAKTSSTLYQAALRIASDDDSKSTILHIIIATIIFIVAMIILRLFFVFTKTGASIAAKLP